LILHTKKTRIYFFLTEYNTENLIEWNEFTVDSDLLMLLTHTHDLDSQLIKVLLFKQELEPSS